jgi:periplasmic protein TonB
MKQINADAPIYSGLVLLGAFAAALLINLALLLLIGALISQREAVLVSQTKPQPIEFIRITPKPPEQKTVLQPKQNKVVDSAPTQKPKDKSALPTPVKQLKAIKSKPLAKKVKKNNPISTPVKAPNIVIPDQATGPEFASIPGTNARLTAPPALGNGNKTTEAKVAHGDGAGAESGGSGIQGLTVLSRVEPRYPRIALERRLEGWVRLEIVVTTEGTVRDAKVIEASPKLTFDQAALEAIRRWRFKPTYKNGQAVEQRAVQRISFKLSKQR